MLDSLLRWMGFRQAAGGHSHAAAAHDHTHGAIDPTIATTDRGIWAIKWSFMMLAITSLLQLAVVLATGSVALLADTIHNVGDAVTAVPLWIAFRLARRKPSPRFTYGYGRVEDLAGVSIILIILASAMVAGYEAIHRLFNPQPIAYLGWVAAAGIIGFIGNEAVAVLRIRVGREIDSAALIADGYHARTDGFTSLAVVLGAAGVWLGFPLADPIIGLLITIAILAIVWQSSKLVFGRMLDGVDPEIVRQIMHAAEHVPGVLQVLDVRARWLGHRLAAELDIALNPSSTVREADAITSQLEKEILIHVPALSQARIRARPHDPAAHGVQLKNPDDHNAHEGHGHAPSPVRVKGKLASGVIEIIGTPAGERMVFTPDHGLAGVDARVEIDRQGSSIESLPLAADSSQPGRLISSAAPEEPHAFNARLVLRHGEHGESLPFRMDEPEHHPH